MNRHTSSLARILFVFMLLLAAPGVQRNPMMASAQTPPTRPFSTTSAPLCSQPGGVTIDPMESVSNWQAGIGNGAVSATLSSVTGYQGQAVQINYDLGSTPGAYAQIRRNFATPLDLSAADHLRFFFKGTAVNTLEVGLVTDAGNYFATGWNNVTSEGWWAQGIWDLRDFRKDGQSLTDRSKVQAVFISVTKKDGDVGGKGSFAVDEITALTLAARSVPTAYEMIPASPSVLSNAQHAADWINNQQTPGGLVKSWQEETAKNAWLYDQALALLVLMEKYPDSAQNLFARLHALQNSDGSWYNGYNAETLAPLSQNKPVGAVSWVVYALARYALLSGSQAAYQDARKGAAWLAGQQRANGSLPALTGELTAPTEPNLDAWWAFQAAGYTVQANKLRDFLLNQVWDNWMGRFLPSPGEYAIFLDNQTWGAAFLHAVGRDQDARRALSYACSTLAWHSSVKTVDGFDGAGPFSVWVEGTLQYAAAHGQYSAEYFARMANLQDDQGGMPGSPDNFSGYIVWLTTWHGVAPTAWLYFAGTGGPFLVTNFVYLPAITR